MGNMEQKKKRFAIPSFSRKLHFCVLLSDLLSKGILTGTAFSAEVAEQSPEGILIVGGGEKSGRRLVGADPKQRRVLSHLVRLPAGTDCHAQRHEGYSRTS